MKNCPYCAEEIEERAVRCPHCGSDLTAAPPSRGVGQPPESQVPPPSTVGQSPPVQSPPVQSPPAQSPPAQSAAPPAQAGPEGQVGEGAQQFSHSGYRYLLGFGAGFFGIWDRETPGPPVHRFPRTDDGWTEAWRRYSAMEPRAFEVKAAGTPPPSNALGPSDYRTARPRAQRVTWVLVAAAVLGIASAGVQLSQIFLLDRLRENPASATLAEAEASDNRIAVVGGIAAVVGVAAIILWFMWQHRSQSNVRAMGANGLRFTPGWAVGWWFIPFANIVQPYRAMRELWQASEPSAGSVDWKLARVTSVLPLWWALFLLTYVLQSIASAQPDTVDGLIQQGWLFLAADLVWVGAAVLAIQLVHMIQDRQDRKAHRLASWSAETGRT